MKKLYFVFDILFENKKAAINAAKYHGCSRVEVRTATRRGRRPELHGLSVSDWLDEFSKFDSWLKRGYDY